MKTRKLITSLIAAATLSMVLGPSLPAASADSVCQAELLEDGKTVTVEIEGVCSQSSVEAAVGKAVRSVRDVTPAGESRADAESSAPATATTPSGAAHEGRFDTSTEESGANGASDLGEGPPMRRPSNAAPRKESEVEAEGVEDVADERNRPPQREAGAPTVDNPAYALSVPGPAPIGVPNFFIEKFRIPPFLLSIYQAAGTEYGVPWQVLAAINEIETDYGRNLNVSSAGAMGWMQFIPSSWRAYGIDANSDGRSDPYNPVDAIFAAARYLRAAGAEKDLRRAIFAYNHADWYVDSVMLRAKLIGGLPDDLVGALTGLTQGRFPVAARATYADDISEREASRRALNGNAARPVESSPTREGIDIYAKAGAPVIAVNDGVIKKIGVSKRLGRYLVLQDVYGNNYTYAQLGKIAPSYPMPKPRPVSAAQIRETLEAPPKDPTPNQPASAGRQPVAPRASKSFVPKVTEVTLAKERLFAHPGRPRSFRAGGEQQLLSFGKPVAGYTTFEAYFKQVLGLRREDVVLRKLRPGSQVIAGTVLGRIDKTQTSQAPHVHFVVRPAGKGAPAVDPKPILDGWKLLESTAIYRAAGKNPFFGPDARNPSIGQLLLLSKETLARRVIADPRMDIYDCGRRDVQAGQIDRRVLATLAFLTASGLRPTVTSLKCGHSYYTKGGSVSAHSSGNAVDIAAINGIPIIGHQGPGSITEMTIRRMFNLQGIMKPNQIISLMTFEGANNTISMADHADHIHVGFRPMFGANGALGEQINAVLKPNQWVKLIDRLNEIDNPVVSARPSKAAIKVKPGTRSSNAHTGE